VFQKIVRETDCRSRGHGPSVTPRVELGQSRGRLSKPRARSVGQRLLMSRFVKCANEGKLRAPLRANRLPHAIAPQLNSCPRGAVSRKIAVTAVTVTMQLSLIGMKVKRNFHILDGRLA
jgi:hypothetical protein